MGSYRTIPLMLCMITILFFKMSRCVAMQLLILVCFFSVDVHAQKDSTAAKPRRRWAVYAGIGPNVYFNNLELARNQVNVVNYSVVARIMWEPEHFLSLGLESGYYRLYTVKTPEAGNVFISNSAIPIQIVVSMKFLKSFYFNGSLGQSILLNEAHSQSYGNFDARTVSLGDFTTTLGYRHPLMGDHFSIGAETKFFYSGRANDCSLALVFVGGYRF